MVRVFVHGFVESPVRAIGVDLDGCLQCEGERREVAVMVVVAWLEARGGEDRVAFVVGVVVVGKVGLGWWSRLFVRGDA